LQLLSFEFAAAAIQTRPLRTIKTQTEIQHACSNREGIFDGDQPLQSKKLPLMTLPRTPAQIEHDSSETKD